MSEPKIGDIYVYPKLKVYDGLTGNFPIRNPDLYFGIEVEAEMVGHISCHTIPGSWKTVEDGSLKISGAEYVTVPIKFKFLEVELKRLFGAIKEAEFSCRTSIHVHMNARDMTPEEIGRFLVIYMIFEKSLYRFAGFDRWKNNFCVPIYCYANYAVTMLSRLLNGGGLYESWTKYHGLNLVPLYGKEDSSARIGTIEFRQMRGNNDVEFILNWCNLISSMKNAAKTIETKQLIEYIEFGAVKSLASTVFTKWLHLLETDEFEEDTSRCLTKTKFVLNKVGTLKNTIDQPKPRATKVKIPSPSLHTTMSIDDLMADVQVASVNDPVPNSLNNAAASFNNWFTAHIQAQQQPSTVWTTVTANTQNNNNTTGTL
jgi:hypothetical protein